MKASVIRLLAFCTLLLMVTSGPMASQVNAAQGPDPLQKCLADNAELVKLAGQFEDKVKHSEGEIPFLGAAYLALWVILFAFLFGWRRSQRNLEREIVELRARLEAAEGGSR